MSSEWTIRKLRREGRSSRALERSFTTCQACQRGDCLSCLDVLRSTYSSERICTCGRAGHEAALPANPPTGQLARPS